MPSNFKTLRPFVTIAACADETHKVSRACWNYKIPACGILAALLLSFTITASAWAASTFNLLDARERGTTVTGAAKGMLTASFDAAIKKDV
ncbi:MAG: hypothetical protein WC484_08715, partial [Candidatus Omnitrophota bacterium]